MTTRGITDDPTFLEVLKDVLEDPRSRWFHSRPDRVGAGLWDANPVRRSTESGFTKAERHLLVVHRSELAFMMREGCLLALQTHPDIRQFPACFELPPVAEWEARCRQELACVDGTYEGATWRAIISDVLTRAPLTADRGQDYAMAALRLEDTANARIYLAVDAILKGTPRTALRILERLTSANRRDEIAFFAWLNTGKAHDECGDHELAIDAYRRALACRGPALDPLRNLFALSILSTDKSGALAYYRELETLGAPREGWVPQTTAHLRDWRAGQSEARVQDVRRTLHEIADHLEPSASEIAHAI